MAQNAWHMQAEDVETGNWTPFAQGQVIIDLSTRGYDLPNLDNAAWGLL